MCVAPKEHVSLMSVWAEVPLLLITLIGIHTGLPLPAATQAFSIRIGKRIEVAARRCYSQAG